jgi:hypothetical protein
MTSDTRDDGGAAVIPRVGDYVVERGSYGYELHQVSAVKGKICTYARYGTRVGNIRMDAIVFAGDEPSARALHERLKSSHALCEDERRKSHERKLKRDAEYISDALLRERNKG